MASFDKIDYTLRPSKQIERKIIIHLLSSLTNFGYGIRDYTYVGFGSIFYYDLILFHKYLNISKLVCLETEDIPKRMAFNKPYDFIDLHMEAYCDYIPKLNQNEKYIIWADYDDILNMDNLLDIGNSIGTLPNESIFIVSFNAERFSYGEQLNLKEDDDILEVLLKNFEEEFGAYFARKQSKNFTHSNFKQTLSAIISSKINEAIAGRGNEATFQFINYSYKDGAQMITMGWIIDSQQKIEELKKSNFSSDPYVICEEEFFNISVPPLTKKEKQLIDQKIVELKDKITAEEMGNIHLDFELKRKHLINYLNVYKYYPEFNDSIV